MDRPQIQSGHHVDSVKGAEERVEESPGPPDDQTIDRLKGDFLEDDLRLAQMRSEIEAWIECRLAPDRARNLGHRQFAADPLDLFGVEPGLARLRLRDGELDQRRRV